MLRQFAILGVALALAGCASTGGTTARPAVASPRPSGASHHATAVRQERAILASFHPPAGAKRLDGPPSGVDDNLGLSPGTSGRSTNILSGVQWWQAVGDPQAVLAAVPVPAGASKNVSSSGGSQWTQGFAWPPVAGVISDQELSISTTAWHGRTIVRVAAEVIWYPDRTAATVIPAGASAVTVIERPGFGVKAKAYGPVQVTAPGTVAAIVKVVNQDPVSPVGPVYHCPLDDGATMALTFRSTAATVATTSIKLTGCGSVTVAVTGGGKATLIGGGDMAKKIESLIGVDWPTTVR
jgi:hypothetical protein